MRAIRMGVVAVAGVAAAIVGVVAAPAASSHTLINATPHRSHVSLASAPAACVTGYLCVVEPGGAVVLVPAGETANLGMQTDELDNQTSTFYCDELKESNGALLNSDIPAGANQTFSPAVTILAVSVDADNVCPG